jgi:hypothetical protein
LKQLPEWMNTQEMKQAMNTLCQFSEKERNYFAYQARQDFLRQQGTILFEKDEAVAERDEAFAERDIALAREQAALEREYAAQAEVERLKALLAQK